MPQSFFSFPFFSLFLKGENKTLLEINKYKIVLSMDIASVLIFFLAMALSGRRPGKKSLDDLDPFCHAVKYIGHICMVLFLAQEMQWA